jgi:LCP family protein required for cell wall assembly
MPSSAARRDRRTVALVITGTLLVLALVTAGTVVVGYRHLEGRLTTGAAIKHTTKKARGARVPLNILLLGTDTRDCDGCRIDREKGKGGSDVTILLHVAADRRSAYGISIPRDSLVDRPACTKAGGGQSPAASHVMWNDAFALGGAACTAQQLEQLSGIYVDHYLTVNFAGFKKMVDAVDGVDVCIPEEVDDTEHHIHLAKGAQTLHGAQALNYVRDRSSTPNSDLGRMKRQQAFLASLIHKVFSTGTLSRPDRLYGFADALAGSITTDPDIDGLGALVGLARQLRHADLQHIQFVTVPNVAYPRDSADWGRLRILPSARRLWQQVAADRPLGRGFTGEAISAGAPPNTTGSPTGTPTGSPTSTPTGSPTSTPTGSPTGTPADTPTRSAEEAAANGLCA